MTSNDSIKFQSREVKEMWRIQLPPEKTFIFGKTKYNSRKVMMLLRELGGKKVKIRMEVVMERFHEWKEWMEE